MNKPFLTRAIARLQRMSIHDGQFALALHSYIMRETVIAWDDKRALFFVLLPSGDWQVAVWLMPIAQTMEPTS